MYEQQHIDLDKFKSDKEYQRSIISQLVAGRGEQSLDKALLLGQHHGIPRVEVYYSSVFIR